MHWPLEMRLLTETSTLLGGFGLKQLKLRSLLPKSWLVTRFLPRDWFQGGDLLGFGVLPQVAVRSGATVLMFVILVVLLKSIS